MDAIALEEVHRVVHRDAETDASFESHRDRLRQPGVGQAQRSVLDQIRSFFGLGCPSPFRDDEW